MIGIVGILDDVTKAVPSRFQRAGDAIVLLMGSSSMPERKSDELLLELGSSELSKRVFATMWGKPPLLDLRDENALHRVLQRGMQEGLFHSAADISDGGLAVTLAKSGFSNRFGAMLLPSAVNGTVRQIADLFAETSSTVLVTCDPSVFERIEEITEEEVGSIFAQRIGVTGGNRLTIFFR